MVFIVNRFSGRKKRVEFKVLGHASSDGTTSNQTLDLVTWNLGYAGLGENANFVADGGKDLLPHSRDEVLRNAMAITEVLKTLPADVYLLQELAGPSLVNRQVDLKGMVIDCLPGCDYVYSSDFRTQLIPAPLKIDIGSAVFSRRQLMQPEGLLLPQEGYFAGFIRKNYRMLVCRFEVPATTRELVIVNVHLAAFDRDAKVRLQQLESVMEYVQQQFSMGNYVIIGGDWNLSLVDTDFPHQTPEQYLFWIAEMPTRDLPEGWKIAADNRVPSVRTVHQAYVSGDNYTFVVDGFVVSPNVTVLDIENKDLGFRNTDHHPVKLRVQLELESKEV